MSAPVEDWNVVQRYLQRLDLDVITEYADCVLPDQIPISQDIGRVGFSVFSRRNLLRRLGNDLHNLPRILVKNYFESLRGIADEIAPVESGARDLKHRVSLMRLRHQADQLGLAWNPSLPWQFEVPHNCVGAAHGKDIHPADLIPDYPSDWLPYDPEITEVPWDFDEYFNTKEYTDFFMERYVRLQFDDPCPHVLRLRESGGLEPLFVVNCADKFDDGAVQSGNVGGGGVGAKSEQNSERGYDVILITMKLLKDAGNLALSEGWLDLAANRYDKALRYAAVVSMSFPSNTYEFARNGENNVSDSDYFPFLTWDELTTLLIRIRLNLSLLFLMPHFSKPRAAAAQALNALHELSPFCIKKGVVMKGKTLTKTHRDGEPEKTYLDAKALQAKAYFRLGSAQDELGEFADAIISFESSVQAAEHAMAKPDKLVLRRLSEAKRKNRRARKRERNKFEFGLSGALSRDDNKNGRPNDCDE
jgi:hypothetical protein